jgi:hypothetical protein
MRGLDLMLEPFANVGIVNVPMSYSSISKRPAVNFEAEGP